MVSLVTTERIYFVFLFDAFCWSIIVTLVCFETSFSAEYQVDAFTKTEIDQWVIVYSEGRQGERKGRR